MSLDVVSDESPTLFVFWDRGKLVGWDRKRFINVVTTRGQKDWAETRLRCRFQSSVEDLGKELQRDVPPRYDEDRIYSSLLPQRILQSSKWCCSRGFGQDPGVDKQLVYRIFDLRVAY